MTNTCVEHGHVRNSKARLINQTRRRNNTIYRYDVHSDFPCNLCNKLRMSTSEFTRNYKTQNHDTIAEKITIAYKTCDLRRGLLIEEMIH